MGGQHIKLNLLSIELGSKGQKKARITLITFAQLVNGLWEKGLIRINRNLECIKVAADYDLQYEEDRGYLKEILSILSFKIYIGEPNSPKVAVKPLDLSVGFPIIELCWTK